MKLIAKAAKKFYSFHFDNVVLHVVCYTRCLSISSPIFLMVVTLSLPILLQISATLSLHIFSTEWTSNKYEFFSWNGWREKFTLAFIHACVCVRACECVQTEFSNNVMVVVAWDSFLLFRNIHPSVHLLISHNIFELTTCKILFYAIKTTSNQKKKHKKILLQKFFFVHRLQLSSKNKQQK